MFVMKKRIGSFNEKSKKFKKHKSSRKNKENHFSFNGNRTFIVFVFIILLFAVSSFSYFLGAKNNLNHSDAALSGGARKSPSAAYQPKEVPKTIIKQMDVDPRDLYLDAVDSSQSYSVIKMTNAYFSPYNSPANLNPFPTKSLQPYLKLKIHGIVNTPESKLAQFYLQGGPQTKVNNFVKNNADTYIADGKTILETVMNIISWEHSVNENQCTGAEKKKLVYSFEKQKYASTYKRTRTAEQIIKSKCFTGCTDFTLVFAALARAKGIPATVTETVRKEWLKENVNNFWTEYKQGHFFSEVYLADEGKWVVVDPTANVLTGRDSEGYYTGPNPDIDKSGNSIGYIQTDKGLSGIKYVLFERGLDSWDYGVKNLEELDQALKIKYFIKEKIEVK